MRTNNMQRKKKLIIKNCTREKKVELLEAKATKKKITIKILI